MSDTLLQTWLKRAPKEIPDYYKTTAYRYVHSELAYFEVWVKGGVPGPNGIEDYDDDRCYKLVYGEIVCVDEAKCKKCNSWTQNLKGGHMYRANVRSRDKKVGAIYLVFASFAHGDHANTIHNTAEAATAVIEQYIEAAKQFGDEVAIEEVAGEESADLDAITKHLENNEDVFVRMDDGTWFTITKTEERA